MFAPGGSLEQTMRRRTSCTLALVAALVVPAQASALPGLPSGAAAAALRAEPRLPVPAGWGFPDAFSRTSGTGRSIGGAFEWTDWVYDAYGASDASGGLPLNQTTSSTSLTPAQGQDVYPSGKADGDGADIFRAAVGLTRSASVWRVDFNTLEDPSIPIAEWTFDTDDDARTGGAAWPAGANVASPGIERALVVSAKGARLLDVASGGTLATFPTVVDTHARSFVVRIPRATLPVGGRWRIRLGAGLADPAGTGFAVPTTSAGGPAPDSAPRLYNVTFRGAAQEPAIFSDGQSGALAGALKAALPGYASELPNLVTANFWGEDDQADTLATGDVSKFAQVVDWSRLAARRRTEPPVLKGWSSRWYVTDLDLGQGVANGGAYPAFVGRVQPYAVYVPQAYTGRRAVPLTWMLHSADSDYLQYAALNPRMAANLCEARGSICATPLGFGGGALYGGDVAEHDVWQVWRQLALAYRLSTDRTVVSGYSAGGVGSFRMSHTYPSVFAAAMPLDGGFEEACSSGSEGPRNFLTALAPDRSANVRWVPEVTSSSYADELSLYPGVVEQARRFEAAGDRFSLFSTTMGEHLVSAAADGFATQIDALGGTPTAKLRPGSIDYSWCPQTVVAKLGLGPTSVYWLSGLAQRDPATPSTMSRVVADDGALPEPARTEDVSTSVAAPSDSPPMHVLTGGWTLGARPAAARRLTLTLTNVRALTVDTEAARLPGGTAQVTTDGPTTLRLTGLARGTRVAGPRGGAIAGRDGTVTVELAQGATVVAWSAAARGR
jgi:hypothetical protein